MCVGKKKVLGPLSIPCAQTFIKLVSLNVGIYVPENVGKKFNGSLINRLTDLENELMVGRREEWGEGIVKELGITFTHYSI